MRGLALALALAAGAVSAAPAPGRYEATLCVATRPAAPPSCGPAIFDIRGNARAEIRVADVSYRLHLRPAQVDVMTMQEKMEIDEFSALYQWQGRVLTFVDADKQVRYQITLGAKTRARR